MTSAAAKAATARYLAAHRAAGGKIVAIRMTAAELERLTFLRLPGESASACVNRMVWLMCHPRLEQIRSMIPASYR